MAEIIIDNLNITGLDLLQDQENFLNELTDIETETIFGGNKQNMPQKYPTIKIIDSSQFVALSVYPPRNVCLPC